MKGTKEATADLHVHSNFSDSDDTIESIFKQAKDKNISCLALTDHDTVDGIKLARQISSQYNIELIEGIEFSCQKDGQEVHILGYFIDIENKQFQEVLSGIRNDRYERMLIMTDKLKEQGLAVDKEELIKTVANVIPTRLHLALHLMSKGVKGNLTEVFRKYLIPGCPAYVNCFNLTVPQAINLIKSISGIAVLAHPHILPNSLWIEEFINYGLDGMEVVYPRFDQTKINYYKAMADKFGILASGGSDAHGSYKKYTKVGEVSIPYSWVEAMKEYRRGQTSTLEIKN